MLLALVAFLVPVFEKVFKDFGGELPAITKFTVALSHIVTRPAGTSCIAVGRRHGLSASSKWKSTERGREQWDRFKLRDPVKIGDIVQKVALARFSRTYSALIAAGVPMLQAIEITGRTAGNRVDRERDGRRSRESVKRGRHDRRRRCATSPTAFPLMVTQMVARGRGDRRPRAMLSKVADFYEDEVAAAVKALTSILEPLMIVVVGAHRRLHRHLDVHADVQGLRPDQVGVSSLGRLARARQRAFRPRGRRPPPACTEQGSARADR